MKKTLIILFAALFGAIQANASESDPTEIAILDGTVVLEISPGVEFPCIGIRLSDSNVNMGLGTALEIKRRDGLYLTRIDNKKYRRTDKAIKAYLKDLFARFYEDKNKKYGKKVWSAFVKEGGLRQFMDAVNEIIDDEFLDSPWNEIYG